MKNVAFSILVIVLFGTCKEKYVSPAKTSPTGYLVVEGVINAGNGATNIILKRTMQLDSTALVYERGAKVIVEGENNTQFNLIENAIGNYNISRLNLNTAIKYRLNINTSDGKFYQSDFVPVQTTPPIDSVSWKQDSLGVHLFVNTQDPANTTKYYQWDFTETWEYHSPYISYYKYVPVNTFNGLKYNFTFKDPILVSFDTTIIKCWQEDNSKSIIIGSTVSLSNNKIYLPLHFVPTGSIKLAVLFSLMTRQYSLSEGKYQYLQKMKKNTESTGTVFDSQPSELKGNIHCVSNRQDPVIGYIDICQIQDTRIFIDNKQLPNWNFKTSCLQREFEDLLDTITFAKAQGFFPTTKAKDPILGPPPFGFPGSTYYSTLECIDCTLTGTNVKPSFWR